MTTCASLSPTRSALTIAGCGTRAPTKSWTRTASVRISARSRKRTRKWRGASASCPKPASPTSRGCGRSNKPGTIEGGSVMKARVHISLKAGVLDPQGKAIGNALQALGFSGVGDVRQGKLIELDLTDTDPAAGRARVESILRRLLAHPLIQDYALD